MPCDARSPSLPASTASVNITIMPLATGYLVVNSVNPEPSRPPISKWGEYNCIRIHSSGFGWVTLTRR
ncbi:hypothetical protein SORBI_3008G060900 [Sorghum bicolor]|uniref:Uncharacterized protein n=1 Tax=Sorghum bicolor TaxID=4558 RepID=A0A1B6PBV6_SORBI|nr:hypothetical protein SORBI_3008G060900 [Sorghum bicolor]